jgi:quercetin dioxygenase-like cupin family protein
MVVAMLIEMKSELEAWRSKVVARIGGANVKVLRMDAQPYAEETHDYDEGLLVIDGEMMLVVGAEVVRVGAGEMYVVPAGVPHAVGAGSHGTLVILDR